MNANQQGVYVQGVYGGGNYRGYDWATGKLKFSVEGKGWLHVTNSNLRTLALEEDDSFIYLREYALNTGRLLSTKTIAKAIVMDIPDDYVRGAVITDEVLCLMTSRRITSRTEHPEFGLSIIDAGTGKPRWVTKHENFSWTRDGSLPSCTSEDVFVLVTEDVTGFGPVSVVKFAGSDGRIEWDWAPRFTRVNDYTFSIAGPEKGKIFLISKVPRWRNLLF
ncbi:MAG: hypothetical protein AAFQ89_12685 [Cyanobacteria bacterium J06626_18]